MDKYELKEYRKTWYWKITSPKTASPDNWICGTPIRLFGKTIAVKWKIAKANYQWNKLNQER